MVGLGIFLPCGACGLCVFVCGCVAHACYVKCRYSLTAPTRSMREGVGIDPTVGGRRVVAVSGVACMLGVHSHRTLKIRLYLV